ncbi:MAG TPA: M23 family metallopeptidase [Acidimicrobiia bacterium]|nr:M23 family metallopeptidase [Acidimicrobiia bacterium]
MRLVIPIRSVVRCLVVCGVVTAAAVPAGARGRDHTPQPAMPAGMAALKAQANQAAARYAAAEASYAQLEDKIADLQAQLSELSGQIGPLRERITRQAVAVYQQDVARAAVASLEAVASAIRSDHSAHLVANVSARDVPAIDALLAAKQGIQDRQRDLVARRHEQDLAIADLAAQRDQISAELTAMAATVPSSAFARLPRSRTSRSASALAQRLVKEPGSFICPIAGPLAFTDDFGAPRGGGRRHMGNDLLNPRGTPNVAVVNGTIETRPWAGGGITIFLHGDDGNTYVYMHLLEIVGAVPRQVAQGEVIGLTGMTGDAQGYHTHFEFHPDNGDAVSPYPLLAEACQ